MDGKTYDPAAVWQQYLDQRFEDEILEILLTAKHLRFNLAQLARSYGVPFDTVEQLATSLALKHLGTDIEKLEFQALIRQIEHLEQQEKDPGARTWKLQALARRYKRTPRQLMEVYHKALCQQSQVQPMSMRQFRSQHSEEVEWLIQGWIPKGTTLLLHAEGGVGKTLFVYEMLEAIAQGKPWNGYATDGGTVLLVQADEPSLVTAERLTIRGIQDTDPVFILPEWQVESMPLLEQWLEQTRPNLVIVDSLTAINRHCIFSENDTEYARPILQLAALANKHGCAVVIIHHSNAEGNSRGSRAIFNSVSEVWSLSNADLKEKLLRVQKTRLGRPPGRYKFLFNEEDFSFRYLGEEDEGEETLTQEEKIRLWLGSESQQGRSFAPVEIAEALGIGKESTRRALRELWAKGLIRRKRNTSNGYYSYFSLESSKHCSNPAPGEAYTEKAIAALEAITPSIASRNDLKAASGKESSVKAIGRSEQEKNFTDANALKARSPDRLQDKVPASAGQASQKQSDRHSDRLSDRQGLIENSSNVSLQSQAMGTECQVLSDGEWIPGKYVGDRGMKFNKLTRSLEPCYRVKTQAGNVDVLASEFQWISEARR